MSSDAIDEKAYRRTLMRVRKAVKMHEKAIELLDNALHHDDVPFSCGESAANALCLSSHDEYWITRRCFGK